MKNLLSVHPLTGVFIDLSSPSVFIGDPWSLIKSFKNSEFPLTTYGNDSVRFVNSFKKWMDNKYTKVERKPNRD